MGPVLRGEGQSKIELCGCGRLHFTYGAVTLHFDKEEFLAFAESVGRLGAIVRQAGKRPIPLPGRISDTSVCH